MDHLIDRPAPESSYDYNRLYGTESNPTVDWLVHWRPLLRQALDTAPDDADAVIAALSDVSIAMAALERRLDREGWPV